MEVSGQLHAPATLLPGKVHGINCIGGWVGTRSHSGRSGEEENAQPPPGMNPRTPIVQPVAQRYTE